MSNPTNGTDKRIYKHFGTLRSVVAQQVNHARKQYPVKATHRISGKQISTEPGLIARLTYLFQTLTRYCRSNSEEWVEVEA